MATNRSTQCMNASLRLEWEHLVAEVQLEKQS
jgi:hypothetical protein